MTRNAEQRAADDRLHQAIIDVVVLADGYDGEILVDWLVSYACVHRTDDERTVYGVAFPNGSLPSYRGYGLLEMARRYLDESTDDEDDA